MRLILLFILTAFSSTALAEHQEVDELPMELRGAWRLCAEQRITTTNRPDCRTVQVPGSWESQGFPDYDGMASYTFDFLLSEKLRGINLGLYIPRIRDADETYINGRLIGRTGGLPPRFDKATLYDRLYDLPRDWLRFNDRNRITIRVYNHARDGGLVYGAPKIDSMKSLSKRFYQKDTALIFCAGLMFLFALIHLFYYVFIPAGKDNLYFTAFCSMVGLFLLTFSNLAAESGFGLSGLFRTNVLLLSGSIISLVVFFYEFFEIRVHNGVRIMLLLLAINGLFSALWPDLNLIYLPLTSIELIGLLVVVPTLGYVLYKAHDNHKPYVKIIAMVIVPSLLANVYDTLVDFNLVPFVPNLPGGLLSSITVPIFALLFSLLLAHKYWQYYRGATSDHLTGSLHQSTFLQRLSQEMERCKRAENCVLMVAKLNLDHFKAANEHFGHVIGDRLLQEVAKKLSLVLRPFDLLCRCHGDEFAIAAEMHTQQDAEHFLERLIDAVEDVQVFTDKDHPLHAQGSIGAAVYDPEQHATAERLMNAATIALHSAKDKNRGGYTWISKDYFMFERERHDERTTTKDS